MRLNKVSEALIKQRRSLLPKSALYTSAFLSLLGAPAFAQEQAEESKAEEQEENVVVIRGLRGTMTRSLNEKKNSTAIVDAIAASDFGNLPGLSMSDIIENIPGASGHRLKGSQNEISIRGLGSYWGYSTFNGRTITNAGPGRAVNFKKFPSELVDKVVIYKSQQADLVEGGTSGTIDVNSLRAVDFGKSQSTIELTGVYNSYYEDVDGSSPWGGKLVFSTVQNWELEDGGAVGFTFGLNHTDSANPEENFGGSSQMGVCALRDSAGNPLSDNGGDCTGGSSDQAVSAGRAGRSPTPTAESLATFDDSSIFYVPNDVFWRTGDDEDERTGVVSTFQWVPNDQWNVNADVEISRLSYHENRKELGLDSRRRALADHIIADDHTLLYATGEARPQLNGESRYQDDDYDGYGINIEHTPNDDMKFTLDLSYSESYRYRLRHRSKIRSDQRYQYSIDARGVNVPVLTFLDDNRNGVGDAGYDESQVFDPTNVQSFIHDGVAYMEYRRSNDERRDDIGAIKFDFEYSVDNDFFSAFKTGVRYSSEHLIDETSNDVSLTLTDGSQRPGSTDTADGNWDDDNPAAHAALVNGFVNSCVNPHNNSGQFDEESGNGGDASNYAIFDSECFIGQMLGVINGGDTTFFDIGERNDKRSGGDRDVTEDILAAYFMADIDTEIGDYPVTGNIGVRVVRNETHSDGWGDKVYITSNPDGTFAAATNITNEIEAVTLDSSYTKVLPSLNLRFLLSDDWVLRTAVYRAMSRFQLNAMSSGVGYTVCEDENDTICDPNTNTDYTQVIRSGSASGNHLNPYMSTNFDISAEYYPSEDAAFTVAYYHKSFNGGYIDSEESRDIIVSLDGADTVYPDVIHTVRQTANDKSTIQGVEITAQKHFVELPEPFNGLGTKLAYNYADSDFVTPEPGSPIIVPDANLFGFSKNVAALSVYWEGEDTTVRLLYKYRSKYLQPNSLPFPDRSHRYVQDSDYLDFSARYKLTSNVSLSLKALNLLNEPQVMTRGNDTTIADYSRSGTKYFIGVKAKF